MYAFIRGPLINATPVYCVVEARGVGYKIFVPPSALSKLPAIGEEVMLYSSFVVRELSHALYGFLTSQERDIFELLMGVTGIGPKLALSIIGHMSPHDLHRALSGNDAASLSKIPGIGKKTAERLIIELRDKLDSLFPFSPSDLAVDFKCDVRSQKVMDAMSALIHLGYTQSTAQKAIKKTMSELSENADLPLIITSALNNVH